MESKECTTVGEIWVEPIPFLEINKLELVKKLGSHTQLAVQGCVDETEKENLEYMGAAGTDVTVKKQDGTILFCGVLTELEMEADGSILIVSIQSRSHTVLLDGKKRIRPYHEVNRMVEELIRAVASGIPHTETLIDEACRTEVGQFVMQYEETDWEFIKRLASLCGQSVYPDGQTPYPAFYVGKLKLFTTLNIDQDIPYVCCRKEYEDNGAYSAAYCLHLDGEWLNLGDCVDYKGMKLYVRSVESRLEHSILRNRYELSFREGLETGGISNQRLGGKSVFGTVTEIKRDRVRVSISSDDGQERGSSSWFPYSTVYASSNGGGWYCMPEPGDKVRVQFPDEDERNAYAVSSVSGYRPAEGASDRMGDYTRRYIRNRQGMQVMWTPDRVIISSNGASLVDVNRNGTISISAQSKIVIRAGKDVEIEAGEQIHLDGGRGIHIQCGAKAEIDIGKDGILALKGNQIFTN